MISAATAVANSLPCLRIASVAALDPWTEAEVYQYANDALKDLAGCNVFAERATVTIPAGQHAISPARAMRVWSIVVLGRQLRPMSIVEVEALSASWPSVEGIPQHAVYGVDGLRSIRAYPRPSTATTATVYFTAFPDEVSPASPTVTIPSALQPYLTARIIAGALARESAVAMPEVAKWFEGIAGMIKTATGAHFRAI